MIVHLPSDEIENAYHLPLAHRRNGESSTAHKRANVVPAKPRYFDDVVTVQKGFSELLRKPFYLVRDQLLDFQFGFFVVMLQFYSSQNR